MKEFFMPLPVIVIGVCRRHVGIFERLEYCKKSSKFANLHASTVELVASVLIPKNLLDFMQVLKVA